MCVSYPALCCGGHTPSSPLTPVPDAQGKNVTLEAIYAVIGELAAVSPDEFFHLGGDEVGSGCVVLCVPLSLSLSPLICLH